MRTTNMINRLWPVYRHTVILIALLIMSITVSQAQTKFIREYTFNIKSGSEALDKQALDKTPSGYVIGGPLFAGYYSYGDIDVALFDPALMTVNEDGSLTGLHKRYNIASPSDTYRNFHAAGIKYIEQVGTGLNAGYLFHGQMRLENIANIEDYGALIKTDLMGNVDWARELTMTDFHGHERPVEIRHVEQVANGKLIVLGSFNYDDVSKFEHYTVVMRIHPATGVVEWKRVLSSFGPLNGDMLPKGMIEDDPGEYYVFGHGALGKASYVLHITDGWFVPSAFEAVYFSTPGFTQASDIDVVDDELILVGDIEAGSWDHNPVFALRLEKSLNSITDLAGNADQATLYFGTNDDPEFLYASNLLVNNERFVITGYRHTGGFGPGTYGTPFNMTVSPSGDILNLRESDEVFWMKKAPHTFNATDSYVTGDKRLSGFNHYRLTSRATDGSTCVDVNIATERFDANLTFDELELTFIDPDLTYDQMVVSEDDYPVTAFNLCEDCTLSAEDVLPITTSTGEASFCDGSSLDLFAPTGFVSYVWFHDGEPFGTGSTVTATEGGTYYVMCYDAAGCEVELSIEIVEFDHCEINYPFPPKTFCSLDPPSSSWVGWFSDPLENCNGDYSYDWTFDGSPVPGMIFGDHATPFVGAGTYSVTVTTPCNSYVFSQTVVDDLVVVTGASQALPAFHSYFGPNVLFEMANFSSAYDYYEWDFTNLTTATSYSFGGPSPFYGMVPYPPNSGETLSVTLSLTDISGCTIYKNNITYIDGPGKRGDELATPLSDHGEKMEMYPNPTNGHATILLTLEDDVTDARIVIQTLDGREVDSIPVNERGKVVIEWSGGDLPAGTYVYSLIANGKMIDSKRMILTP